MGYKDQHKFLTGNFVQIQQKLQALLEEKKNVYNAWREKKEWLEKIHQEQMFYKDWDHLDMLLNSQEVSKL